MRRNPTSAEQRLWNSLRNRRLGGLKFRRQVPIDRFIVDFVCYERRLIVEADGAQHADCSYDERRDHILRAHGFEILRFWNHSIQRTLDDVCLTILKACGKAEADEWQ
ncbi:MAG: endonuclease domain-containing protein [Pseudomonadota bacterium]